MIAAERAQLSILTDSGPADPAQPFRAFGALGSRLVIDHPLLHGARLARIAIAIDWEGFPKGAGLRGYYKGYDFDPPVRDSSFIVTVTAPLSGWAGGKRLKLFPSGAVSRFDLVANGTRETGGMPVTIALTAPAQSFGETGYARAVMAAALRAAAAGGHGAYPNPPWLPLAKRIALKVALAN